MKTLLLIFGLTALCRPQSSAALQDAVSDPPMILIPAGEFTMGKDLETSTAYGPAHSVQLDAYYIDRHEVTNREYLAFCKASDQPLPEFWNTSVFSCGEKFLDYPVVGVTWWDANAYAEWSGKRLPTEAEWEYAARGGLIGREYPNGDEWTKPRAEQDGLGWRNLIEPVEQYEANGFGLFDTGGNVWEWVADYYSSEYYDESEIVNPEGPETGTHRIIRGGSWHSGPMCKRVYYRKGLPSGWNDFAVGFRCVKDRQ